MPSGRKAKPLQLHLADGNPSHLTKQEIQDRIDGEIRLGDADFCPPERIERNPTALREWDRITSLYIDGNISFASTADTGVIERRCLAFSDLEFLRDARDEYIANSQKCGVPAAKIAKECKDVDARIVKLNDLLLRLDKELLLTPVARISRIVKVEKHEKESDPSIAMFGE